MIRYHFTNRHGARIVSCADHVCKRMSYVYGAVSFVGTTDEICDDCRDEAAHNDQPRIMETAIREGRVLYTRARYGSVYAYGRNEASPTGVTLLCGLDPARYAALEERLKSEGIGRGVISPLSPTEGMRQSR
jgi:hypothetical protein